MATARKLRTMDHYIEQVLGQGANSETKKALDKYGAASMRDVLVMSETTIESLKIPASTAGDPDEDVTRMTKDLLLKVAAHNRYFCQKHGVTKVEDTDWSGMTSDDFDEFLGCYDPNSTASTTKQQKTPAEEF